MSVRPLWGLQSLRAVHTHGNRQLHSPFSSKNEGGAPWLKKYLNDVGQCQQRLQRLHTLPGAPESPKWPGRWGPERARRLHCGSSLGSACRTPTCGCGKASRLAQLKGFPVPASPAPRLAVAPDSSCAPHPPAPTQAPALGTSRSHPGPSCPSMDRTAE
jgi:hypothetical protein